LILNVNFLNNNSIYEALRTLYENYTDTNKIELQKDFKSYWENYYLPIDFKTTCVVTPNRTAREVIAYRDTRNERKKNFLVVWRLLSQSIT
jgi:hypothetical protein